jgi:hypothetical protein
MKTNTNEIAQHIGSPRRGVFMVGKDIVLMGIGFDPEKRNIGNYLLESL